MTDFEKIVSGQIVEWDKKKAALNRQKHGVEFEDIENRWQVIGEVGEILFVVYTERGAAFRLITARMATPEERRIYYGAQNYL